MKICNKCECELVGRNANGKFCSNKCQQDYLYEQYIKKWKHGEVSGSIKNGSISKYVRRYMLEQSNYKCTVCGWGRKNPYSNTYPLVVDHIDGNSDDSTPHNLRVLCPNCDSLTSTYKFLNNGNGRYKRKQRYNEGKSY